MSDIKTKYTFDGNPECGACSAKSGEYDCDPGKGHPNCQCKISIQGTREECKLDSMVAVGPPELIDVYFEYIGKNPKTGDFIYLCINTYQRLMHVILECVRVDADTGKELGPPYYREDDDPEYKVYRVEKGVVVTDPEYSDLYMYPPPV